MRCWAVGIGEHHNTATVLMLTTHQNMSATDWQGLALYARIGRAFHEEALEDEENDRHR